MKPVVQTVIGSGDDGQPMGNCMRAALSSITEIPLDQTPAFELMDEDKWIGEFFKWLADIGFEYKGCRYDEKDMFDSKYNKGVDGFLFVAGGSPRGFRRGHAVVYKDGKLAHDPHPSGEGITEFEYFYMLERINDG